MTRRFELQRALRLSSPQSADRIVAALFVTSPRAPGLGLEVVVPLRRTPNELASKKNSPGELGP
jgi:hypothetical protein